MKYYIKQKLFSFNEQFTIKNSAGEDLFFAEGSLFKFPKEFKVVDTKGRELLSIKEELFAWMPKFYLFIGEEQVAAVTQKFNFFQNNYIIEGLNWEVKGSITAHEYVILEDGRPIAEVSKKYFAWSDTYEISVMDNDYTDVILGIVICIDAVLAKESN